MAWFHRGAWWGGRPLRSRRKCIEIGEGVGPLFRSPIPGGGSTGDTYGLRVGAHGRCESCDILISVTFWCNRCQCYGHSGEWHTFAYRRRWLKHLWGVGARKRKSR